MRPLLPNARGERRRPSIRRRARSAATAILLGAALLADGGAALVPVTAASANTRTQAATQAQPSVEAPTSVAQDGARARAEDAGIDVEAVVDDVSHRVVSDPARPGRLTVSDDDYRASFDASGFALAGAASDGPFGWSLHRLSRGAETAVLHTGMWTAEANVAERRVAPATIERVSARRGEVEWDLVLASPPAGRGDLTVEAGLSGLDGAPQRDGAGWSLPLSGVASVHVGELVVLDATGVEVHRGLPDVDADLLSLRVPAQVLDAATYPLTLDPTVTPEHLVSRVGTEESEYDPAVAFDGDNFLVVWHDQSPTSSANIVGTRVSPEGVVLDLGGILISPAAGSQVAPALAFDGTNYLVVWKDDRVGAGFDIYGARVAPSGTVIDDINGFAISSAVGDQDEPTVAFNGTDYLVAWSDVPTTDIFGTRVSPGALVRDPTGIPISTSAGLQRRVRVAPSGANVLAVWEDSRSGVADIYGARVSRAGVVLNSGGIAISTAADLQVDPDVASDGTNALVVWEDHRTPYGNIRASRVSSAGAVLDPNGIRLTNTNDFHVLPSVSFGDGEYLVTWSELLDSPSPGIHGSRVSPGGSVLDRDVPISVDFVYAADSAAAFGGGVHLVVYGDPRFATIDISGARVDPGGPDEVLDPTGLLLTAEPTEQTEASVAFDGTNFLVTWEDRRNGSRDIYATRVSPTGTVLDPRGIAVSNANVNEATPDVVWNGTDFVVVWEDYRSVPGPVATDIFAARVSSEGDVLDPSGIHVSNGMFNQSEPAIVFDGTDTFVVWTDYRSAPDTDIYGTRLNEAGIVQNPNGIAISTNPDNQSHPVLAFDGTRHLVVWHDDRSGSGLDIYGARVTRLGLVLNPAGLAISTAVDDQENPAVAFDGANNLVVWQDHRSGTSFDIYGTGVTTTGSVTDPTGTAMSTAPGDQRAPAVAFNGAYLVAWLDRQTAGANNRIFGTRFSTSGVVQDNPALALGNTGGDQGSPDLTAGPDGRWGIAYEHPSYGGDGIFLRNVAPK